MGCSFVCKVLNKKISPNRDFENPIKYLETKTKFSGVQLAFTRLLKSCFDSKRQPTDAATAVSMITLLKKENKEL